MRFAVLVLALSACAKTGASPRPAFELDCDSADTDTQATLYCVRTDTRNGDVVVLDLAKLPLTTGSAKAADAQAGTYVTHCSSTNTAQKADFRCVRMDSRTGDVVMLRLSELPRWP
ncbi:MAG: hypothetical protein AB7T06_27555 [Kofleriaceae bacterium]